MESTVIITHPDGTKDFDTLYYFDDDSMPDAMDNYESDMYNPDAGDTVKFE